MNLKWYHWLMMELKHLINLLRPKHHKLDIDQIDPLILYIITIIQKSSRFMTTTCSETAIQPQQNQNILKIVWEFSANADFSNFPILRWMSSILSINRIGCFFWILQPNCHHFLTVLNVFSLSTLWYWRLILVQPRDDSG